MKLTGRVNVCVSNERDDRWANCPPTVQTAPIKSLEREGLDEMCVSVSVLVPCRRRLNKFDTFEKVQLQAIASESERFQRTTVSNTSIEDHCKHEF